MDSETDVMEIWRDSIGRADERDAVKIRRFLAGSVDVITMLRRPSVRHLARQHLGKDTCWYCSCKLGARNRTREHLIPLCRGGSDDRDNVVMACKDCNELLGDAGVDVKVWFREFSRSGGIEMLPRAETGAFKHKECRELIFWLIGGGESS